MPVRERSKPGSQSALRLSNQRRILSTVSGGPTTQADIARTTGLSTATVSNIVKVLVELGLVATSPTTSSGRRAQLVSLSSTDGAVSVGIDFGRRHVRIIVATLDYRVIAEKEVEIPAGYTAAEALDIAANLLTSTLNHARVPRSSVLGVGVGVPGPIDRRTGTVVDGAILPEWVGVTVGMVEEIFELPVYLENDANLGVLAEVTWGSHAGTPTVVFVKVGTGIGAGLILNGVPYSGNIGLTGEIGHTPIYEHGLLCRCGNRGCLETVASTTIMIELLSRTLDRPVRTRDIVRMALEGDERAIRVVEEAGLAVGRSIAAITNLINPHTIIVGGPLTGLGEMLLGPIRSALKRYAVPMIMETTDLVMSSLGERAEALGGAALVLQQAGIKTAVS
ncbi:MULTISPECIES: ROK family transcriptional regulator [Cryobacterium]|uniref:ROK family transcriptional regulator n=1 Tax=Cryobacterium zongtaii TaxID=1259217 RepID=A0A2S3Z9Q4_9MICO|nr:MULTISPECIES: ROK family transcriptional regulator [Cryobacterium]POH62289.1 ROK family transcriptional regulator [Cryobacterium zongtaii]POH66048.1 ROK family transcriptional regulator [Cryobacterium zongtaii]TFC46716.1 ROK family transcriptional regulator [Cryobacterium sp. TMN-39-2]